MTSSFESVVGVHGTPGAPSAQTPGSACPACGQPVGSGDEFCESCGAALVGPARAALESPPVDLDQDRTHLTIPGRPQPEAPPTVGCNQPGCAGHIEDGYCNVCGARAPTARDHFTAHPADWVGAVSDRGRRHWRNEDAVAVAADAAPGSFCALVVCDGVTTSTDSDQASVRAAEAALAVLVDARPQPRPGRSQDFWAPRVAEAAAAANAAAAEVAVSLRAAGTMGATDNPPASTLVAVVYEAAVLVCGSIGDSRAYWLPDGSTPVTLSADDSWAAEQVRAGRMQQADAEADPRAHAITRWLGADSPNAAAAISVTLTGGFAGWLLVCSDGLWNYCSAAADLATLATRLGTDAAGAVELAGACVDWANAQGGQDNVTVALARIPAHSDAPVRHEH